MPLKKARGKPQIFTDEQLTALRRAADALAKLRGFESQQGLADILEISQQSAGDFWKRGGGITYINATALVQELGLSGVDEFFLKEGVMTMRDVIRRKPRGPVAGDQRNDAAKIALVMDIKPDVIARVNERFATRPHSVAWWVAQYTNEQAVDDPEWLARQERLLTETSGTRPAVKSGPVKKTS